MAAQTQDLAAKMDGFAEIPTPQQATLLLTAAQLQSGPPVDPFTRILTYAPDEWEKFIFEWVSVLKATYSKIVRFTGSGDRGIDVAGFRDNRLLNGKWDNFQCKHYATSIQPSVAWPELGKIIWHSFQKHYAVPENYFFVAPRETSTSLTQLLANAASLKAALEKAWDRSVRKNITLTQEIPLEGELKKYFDEFNFSIFKMKTVGEVLDQHRASPYYVTRFGGGLPARPLVDEPPQIISPDESRYVERLLEAYADYKKMPNISVSDLKQWSALGDHFKRSREAFYHAESLRVFVRDKVEPGTFESLQQEVFDGVVDTCESGHEDGYRCLIAVTNTAQSLALEAHPLAHSTFPTDRRGICHQLANEDRLKWVK